MNSKADLNLDLLRRLCETPGVAGREEKVRALIEQEIEGLFDEVHTDPLGSLICTRRARLAQEVLEATPTRVMLACHMDEIGFYVSHIDDKGFLWIDAAGGFDTRNLFHRRVRVCTEGGELQGVLAPGGLPVHLSSPEERKRVPEVKQFFVDVGLSPEQAAEQVKIGDFVVMDVPFALMGERAVSKALDNRLACWLGIESLRALEASGEAHACEIVVAFTTQEEVGLRGARTAAFGVRPDIGIGLDITLACDTPGVPEQERVSKQGDGFVLHVKDSSFISDHALVQEIEGVAKTQGIPCQRSILGRGGQDGAALQQAAAGARAVGITVGTRYVHTPSESVHLGDLRAARDIVTAALGSFA